LLPMQNFTGPIKLKLTVQQANGATDEQAFTISVGYKPITDKKGVKINAVSGSAGSGITVATFKDPNSSGKAEDWSATIDCGDSQTSTQGTAVTIIKNSDGTFAVRGSNAYRSEGTFPVIVTVTNKVGGASEKIFTTAKVADAALTSTPAPILGYE